MRHCTFGRLAGTVCALVFAAVCARGQNAPDLNALRSDPINTPTLSSPGTFSTVRVSEYQTVDLFVNRVPVTQVLQQLAIQSRRNIIPSEAVTGTVTANLSDVPFFDALEALLHPNGYGFIERNDFIFVYTRDEMAAISEVEDRPQTRVIHLNYLLASDAVAFAEPLLSGRGSVQATIDTPPEGGESETDFSSSETISDPVYDPENNRYSMGNAIVVYDFPQYADEVEALLRSLDTKPAQVLIEATALQVTLTESNAFGVDFAFLPNVQLTDFFNFGSNFNPIGFDSEDMPADGAGTTAAGAPDNRSFVTSTAGNTGTGDATVRVGIFASDDIGIFIRALDEVSDLSLLSNPKVVALNRQRARVFVGARVGYLVSTVADGVVVQTVEFLNEGIELDFRPFIQDDDAVRLELSPRISDVDTSMTVPGPGGTTTVIPTQALQTVTTHVTVPKGTTAVLGGLFQEQTTLTRRQVPILGDMPVIGGAFRGHDDGTMRTEVVFLVKPTIMSDAQQVRQGLEAEGTIDRVRTGSRQGLLFWSKERQISRLNVQAERLAAEGKTEEAMWALRRSLELKPFQQDAVRIREQILSQPEWWPNPSMLDRISRAHIDAMLSKLGRETDRQERDDEARAIEEGAAFEIPEREREYTLVPITPSTADQEGESEDSGEDTGDGAGAPADGGGEPALPDLPEIPDLPDIR